MKKQIRNGLIAFGILAGMGVAKSLITHTIDGYIFAGVCIVISFVFYFSMNFKRKEK